MNPRWIPALILGGGVLAGQLGLSARERELRVELRDAIPSDMLGRVGRDLPVRDAELRSARTSSHIARAYRLPGADTGVAEVEVHVCYYRTASGPDWPSISHRLCHMEPDWAVVQMTIDTLSTTAVSGGIRVYDVRRGSRSGIMLFWYQARGRIEQSGVDVRWHRIRDVVLARRNEEALVRVFVPLESDRPEALKTGRMFAREVATYLTAALPPMSERLESE